MKISKFFCWILLAVLMTMVCVQPMEAAYANEVVDIADGDRINILNAGDAFVGSGVGVYDGKACMDMRVKLSALTKATDGYYYIPGVTVSVPNGITPSPSHCRVIFVGDTNSGPVQMNSKDLSVSNGTITFDIPFNEEMMWGDAGYRCVTVRFRWQDSENGNLLLEERVCCEIIEAYQYITDTNRIDISNIGNAYSGFVGKESNGAAWVNIDADFSKLNKDSSGYYQVPLVSVKAPEGAVSCVATFIGRDYSITDPFEVSGGKVTFSIPYNESVICSEIDGYYDAINMRLRWKNGQGELLANERAYCQIWDTAKGIVGITDPKRFDIPGALLDSNGAYDGSRVNQYPDDVVCIDMRADFSKLTKDEGYYWIPEVILIAPENAVSCDIVLSGENRDGVQFKKTYTRSVNSEYGIIGFDVPFNEGIICGDGNYGNVTMLFIWKDSSDKTMLIERAYCEIMEKKPGFETIPGIPANSYTVTVPASLQDNVEIVKEDGLVTITVKEATAQEWADAYLASEPGAQTILADVIITAPEGTDRVFDMQGGMKFEEFISGTSDLGNSVYRDYDKPTRNGESIAQIVEGENGYTFIPMGNLNNDGIGKHRYLAWYDKDKTNQAEAITRGILEIRVVVADGVDKVEVGNDLIPKVKFPEAYRVVPNRHAKFSSVYDAQTGILTFKYSGTATTADAIISDLKAYINENNIKAELSALISAPGGYDKVEGVGRNEDKAFVSNWYGEVNGNSVNIEIRPRTISMKWTSSTDTTKLPLLERITIAIDLNGVTWMDKYWEPVPTSRMEMPAAAKDYLTIKDGYVHTTFEDKEIPDADELKDFEVRIAPPIVPGKEIKGLKTNSSGGTAPADYSDSMADEQKSVVKKSEPQNVNNVFIGAVNLKTLTVNGVTILFNERMGGPDVTILEWYDNEKCEGAPVCREYIQQTEDTLFYETETDSFETEEEVTKPVERPTLVGKKNWKLKLHRFPQENGNDHHAYYFRLEVKSNGGAKPNDKWIVYLPFDFLGEDVKTLEDAMDKVKGNKKITINHYDDNHKLVEVLEGKITKNGIKFSSKSFSPLVIEVEDIVESLVTGTNGTELKVTQKEDVPEDAGYYGEDAKKALAEKYGTENTMAVVKVKLEKEAEADISGIPGVKTDTLESVVLEISLQYLDASSNEWKKVTKENLNMIPEDGVEVTIPFELFDFTDVEHLGNYEFLVKHLITLPANGSHYNVGDIEDMKVTVMGNGLKITVKNGFSPFVVAYAEKYVTSGSSSSSGSGISVTYNGGNSFSTSNSAVPTSVEIDGVAVPFTGNGSNFTVGCIDPNAKWVTVKWNSTSVTTNFKPDATVSCINMAIPKTGDVSVLMPVLMLMGALAIQYKKSSK